MTKANEIDAEATINSLILRGISVANPISKNEIIREIYNIWTNEITNFGKLLKTNKLKTDDLSRETKNYQKLLKEFQDMQNNTSFFQVLKNNSISKNFNSIIDSIQKLESQIEPHEKSKPNLLNLITQSKDSPEVKQLQYLDLFFRRSEELSYIFKRKIIDIERSHYVSQHIKEHEYSSVFQLIDTYDIVKHENDILKIEESSIFSDSILKRRKVSHFSNEVASNLALIYQNDYESSINFLKLLEKRKLKEPKQSISIDDIFKDPLFMLDTSDYSLDFPSNKIMSSKDKQFHSKLDEYQALYNDLDKSCKELEQELHKLRLIKFSSKNQTKGNIEKLWDLNDRLLAEIQKEEDYIDSSVEVERKLCKQITDYVNERKDCSLRYVMAYDKYLHLVQEHTKLVKIAQQNNSLAHALFKVSLSFALKNFLDSNGNEVLDDYFKQFFKSEETSVIVEQVISTEIIPKAPSQKTLFDMIPSKKKKKVNSIKSKRQSKFDSPVQKVVEDVEKCEIPESLKFSLTKLESLILVTYCMKHSGFLIGFNQNLHDVIKKTFDSILSVGHTRVAQFLQDFSNELFPNINLIRDLSKPFLIIETTEKRIQTEPPKLAESEVQTIDPKIIKESLQVSKKKK